MPIPKLPELIKESFGVLDLASNRIKSADPVLLPNPRTTPLDAVNVLTLLLPSSPFIKKSPF